MWNLQPSAHAASAPNKRLFIPFAATGKGVVEFQPLPNGGANGSTITSVSQGNQGGVQLLGNGTQIHYIAGPLFSEVDSFTYIVTDSNHVDTVLLVDVVDYNLFRGNHAIEVAPNPGVELIPSGGADGVLTVDGKGNFTGRQSLLGSISGHFDKLGNFVKVYSPPYYPSLHMDLSLNDTSPVIEGSFLSGHTFTPYAYTVSTYLIAPAGENAGRYTALFQPTGNAEPGGTGWAAVKINANGQLTFVGRLGDGLAFSFPSALRGDGTFPVYVNGYPAAQVGNYEHRLQGNATLRDNPDISDFDGAITWSSMAYGAPRVPATTYPQGFSITVNLIGSRLSSSGGLITTLDFGVDLVMGDIDVEFVDGGLTQPIHTRVELVFSNSNRVISVDAPIKDMTIQGKDSFLAGNVRGLFSGHFLHPGVNAIRSFSGVVFQKQDRAAGFFRGDTTTGTVILNP